MNCNNFGNYFLIIGHERDVKKDDTSYRVNNTYYPLTHCYKCRPSVPVPEKFFYSDAIDMLFPEEFVRWKITRFRFNKFITRVKRQKLTKEGE
jgi:hypothetical protein